MNDHGSELRDFLRGITQGGLPLMLKYSRQRNDLDPGFIEHLEKALEIAEAQLSACRSDRVQ